MHVIHDWLDRRCACVIGGVLLASFGGAMFIAGCGSDDSGSIQHESGALIDPPPISATLQAELEDWLRVHGQAPADYILGLYTDADVVCLGEQHRIRHDALLVQALIPKLPSAGVHVLATEFARRVDQPLLDSLVTAPAWDEALGREIIFRQFVIWGYREYVDILKAVWQYNRDRAPDARPIRVVSLNHEMDFSHFRSEADWEDPDVWKKVTGNQSEADWARVILDEVDRGEKVLVHCGIHHGFTGFRQPRVRSGEFAGFIEDRMGNHLREALGNRAVTVYLHAAWSDSTGAGPQRVHPADGRLDAFMLAREGGPFAVGFDTANSPLGALPIENAVYALGYDPLTMARLCDGWVYTCPLHQYEPVTYIDDWVTAENLTRAQAGSMNPRFRRASLERMIAVNKGYQDEFRRFQGVLR